MSPSVNLFFGWLAILTGLVSGAGVGMFFHDEQWLGGYASWRRRMVRLGHISFLGTGLLNVAFALTCEARSHIPPLPVASALLLVGAVTMPLTCFLAAWRKPFRHAFVVPVGSLIGGVGELAVRGWLL